MGTSTRMPTKVSGEPNWGKLSGDITRACDGRTTPPETLNKILGRFVQSVGGASKGGRGLSTSVGKAGISSGRKIAAFISDVANRGFEEALKEIGLGDLTGKSTQDVINHILDYCAENANTIDEVAARAAAAQIFSELFNESDLVEDVVQQIEESLTNEDLNEILTLYYGYYIYEHLSIRFFEKLEQAKDSSKCNKLFKEIRDYIVQNVKTIHKRENLSKINWAGKEGADIIKGIFEDILKIYGGYED